MKVPTDAQSVSRHCQYCGQLAAQLELMMTNPACSKSPTAFHEYTDTEPASIAQVSEGHEHWHPKDDSQLDLLVLDEDWRREWIGMPEFEQESLEAFATITIRFPRKEDLDEFSRLIGQTLTTKTKSIWHPEMKRGLNAGKRWSSDES